MTKTGAVKGLFQQAQMTKILCAGVLVASLFVAGCGDGSDLSSGGQREPAEHNPPTPIENDPPNSGADREAREAFRRSLAAGEQIWLMSHVEVSYLKRNAINNSIIASWTVPCEANRLELNGEYPNLGLSMGPYSCGNPYHPYEISQLELITRNLAYAARYVPSEPMLFHLLLQSFDLPQFHFASQAALRAQIKARSLFFDFLGIEVDDIGGINKKSTYLVEISMLESGGDGLDRIKISFNEDSAVRRESVEVRVSADLLRGR